MWIRATPVLLMALLGSGLALLGLAAALDVVSLRDFLLVGTELSRLSSLAERLHTRISHRSVQALELGAGLGGLGLLLTAAWLARARRVVLAGIVAIYVVSIFALKGGAGPPPCTEFRSKPGAEGPVYYFVKVPCPEKEGP